MSRAARAARHRLRVHERIALFGGPRASFRGSRGYRLLYKHGRRTGTEHRTLLREGIRLASSVLCTLQYHCLGS